MNRFLKAFFVLVLILFSCLRVEAAGSTPISGLKLTSDAVGGNFNFTNLNVVGCNTAVVQWIKLGTNTSIQNWSQAVVAGGGLTNGAAGTWTNLSRYFNDAGFITNPVAGRISAFDTNAWWMAYNASTNTAIVGGSAPGFIFADASTNLSYLMALTNGASGVNFASLLVAFNATGNTQVVNYQTMTGYVASAISGTTNVPPLSSVLSVGNMANTDINLGSNNLREVTSLYFQTFTPPVASILSSPGRLEICGPAYSNSVIFSTSPYVGILHSIGGSKWKVDVDTTNGQEIVNYQSMTGYVAQALSANTNETLQSVVTRNGTVTSGIVTIDSANLRTNTVGGYLTVLGNRVQGGFGSSASGLASHAEGKDRKGVCPHQNQATPGSGGRYRPPVKHTRRPW